MPGELRKKIKAATIFLGGELMIFGVAAVFADLTPGIPLSVGAKFLGISIFFHLASAWMELKFWKKQFKKLHGYLR